MAFFVPLCLLFTIALFIIGMTLPVFILILMSRSLLSPLLLIIQTFLSIGFIRFVALILP